ncbi:MAG TPA: hypothetical protein VN726_22990 [Hanamia sp.]|nr:hypothetical protein [Hanamia sp.]
MENIKCQRCGKEININEAITQSIGYRDREMKYDSWKKKWVSKAIYKTKQMTFCSSECAGNEQMSNEG